METTKADNQMKNESTINNSNVKSSLSSDRSNMKKNRVVNLPECTFTIDDLCKINSNFIPITLRSRLTKMIHMNHFC